MSDYAPAAQSERGVKKAEHRKKKYPNENTTKSESVLISRVVRGNCPIITILTPIKSFRPDLPLTGEKQPDKQSIVPETRVVDRFDRDIR